MTLTLDFGPNGEIVRWALTATGAEREVQESYRPTLFIGDTVSDLYGRAGGPDPSPPARSSLSEPLADLRAFLDGQQAVADLSVESHRQTFRTAARPVLRIDAASIEDVRTIANRMRQFGQSDTYTCYNVDFTRQLRFCLETETPAELDRAVRDLRTLELTLLRHESEIASLPQLTVDGETLGSSPREVLTTLQARLTERDPDVVVVSTADLVPLLFEAADAYDVAFELGRRPGYTKLAGESTYTSYGNVGHSPARYTVPGRVLIDTSNSFFYYESGLAGCLDLVSRSGMPLEELGWASLGRVLTACRFEKRDRVTYSFRGGRGDQNCSSRRRRSTMPIVVAPRLRLMLASTRMSTSSTLPRCTRISSEHETSPLRPSAVAVVTLRMYRGLATRFVTRTGTCQRCLARSSTLEARLNRRSMPQRVPNGNG